MIERLFMVLGRAAGLTLFLSLNACSSLQPIETPGMEQFPDREYRIQLKGTPEAVRRELSGELVRMAVPFRHWKDAGSDYLVSTLVEDPENDSLLTDNRIAFLMILQPDKIYPYCSEVSLRWISESKGNLSRVWKVQGHDREYTPRLAQLLSDYAANNRCLPR